MASKLKSGYLQVYTGCGKGKTTAAFGLALRGWGQGLRVCIIQFMKKNPASGEYRAAKKMGARFLVKQFGRKGFIYKPNRKDKQLAQNALRFAAEVISAKKYDLVILDEINCAFKLGLLTREQALALVEKKPRAVELIFTGRSAPRWLLEQADLVTEMREKKHYFAKRVLARRGIEY